jgi:hypothetical protein
MEQTAAFKGNMHHYGAGFLSLPSCSTGSLTHAWPCLVPKTENAFKRFLA